MRLLDIVLLRLFTLIILVASFSAFGAARADSSWIARDVTSGTLSYQQGLIVHRWQDKQVRPQAILIGIHGMSLDGQNFEPLAKLLAPEGFIVLAPDMRGFGHWYFPDGKHTPQTKLDYDRTVQDLTRILESAREENPHLPIFLAGESLGVSIALQEASEHPDLVDGLVLSGAPAKRCQYISPRMIASVAFGLIAPHHEFDMSPYVLKYVSEDPRIIQERLNDPLRRNRLSIPQLLLSAGVCKRTMKYGRSINSELPVLVLQGDSDEVVRPKGAFKLFQELPSTDKSLRVFQRSGHVLLETAYLKRDVVQTLNAWLLKHKSTQTAFNAEHKLSVSSHPRN